jgi:hypothetical protein
MLLTIIVSLVFFIIQIRATQPKLIAVGSGSSTVWVPNRDVMASSITIINKPTFLGMKVNRGAAQIQSARLFDRELNEFVGPPLMWRKKGARELGPECALEPGQQSTLYIFAKERHANDYFLYAPRSLDSEYDKPFEVYGSPRKDFSVHLTDIIGARYRFDISVRNGSQHVNIQLKLTWHARSQMIREALSLFRRALTPG